MLLCPLLVLEPEILIGRKVDRYVLPLVSSLGFGSVFILAFVLWLAAPLPETDVLVAKAPQNTMIDKMTVASTTSKTVGDGAENQDLVRKAGFVFGTDTVLNEAARAARHTQKAFDENFQTKRAGRYSIKVVLADGGKREPLWLTITDIVDDSYVGELADVPKRLTSIDKGQEIQVSRDEIVDWMLQDDTGIYGAFTTRVLLSRQDDAYSRKALERIRNL